MQPDTFILTSPRLSVEIARPGSRYAGSRFDWTGFVTQVTLDGRHTFCVPEDYDPEKGSGGVGLCNEFGIDAPVGYDDCPVGGLFPKIGIGLLRRPDGEAYNFFRPYEVAQPFPLDVTAGENSITFRSGPLDARGYAVALEKRLSVQDNWLHVEYTLANAGAQPVQTNEYVHNFIGIDRQPLGPSYRLTLAAPVTAEPLPWQAPANHLLRVEGREIRLAETPQAAFYLRAGGQPRANGPQWEIRHEPSAAAAREYVDFDPMRVAVWGTTHVISAELFIDLALAPGETRRWQRRFEFIA